MAVKRALPSRISCAGVRVASAKLAARQAKRILVLTITSKLGIFAREASHRFEL
jgi:hypothetical protein